MTEMITMDEEPATTGKNRPAGIRFQERMQRIEKAIDAWSNISGEYPAGVVAEAERVLIGRVTAGAARIQTERQLTLYSQLEARAIAEGTPAARPRQGPGVVATTTASADPPETMVTPLGVDYHTEE